MDNSPHASPAGIDTAVLTCADVKVEAAPPLSDSLPERPAPTSLFRYSPGLILVAIALADIARFADPDIWGHVRFGQAALQQGHLAWTDPYSYTAFGRPWLNHEWMSEVIMGALFNLAGVFGLKLMKLACTAVTLCFIAAAESETGAPILLQLGILLASAVCIAPQIQFRPQAFSFAILSALIYMLTRDLYRRRAPLWLAVPMLAVWANLHGAFILGLLALAIYTCVSAGQDVVAGRRMRRTYRLAAITILAILATLATPYGIGTWQAVWHALANPYTRTIIVDWQPLTTQFAAQWHFDKASVIYMLLGVFLIVATIVSFLLAPAIDDLPILAIAAVMSIAAFVSVRNLPAAVIALAAALARHLPLALRKLSMSLDPNSGPIEPATRFNQALLVAGALMVFVQSDLFSNHLGTKDPYPSAACDFMDTHHLHGNLLSLFGWGEY
jgi:hypothetical protein